MEKIKRLLTSKVFYVALASFVYQLLQMCGVKIDFAQYQHAVDFITGALIFAGMVHDYPEVKEGE